MNLLVKILMLPVARREVPANTLVNFKNLLRIDLKKCEVLRPLLSDSLLERLVQEAYQRAADADPDGKARNCEMYRQVEQISSDVTRMSNGETEGDGSIRSILKHHGFQEPPKRDHLSLARPPRR